MEESRVPPEQRFLRVEGIAHLDVCEKVFKELSSKIGPNRVCPFVSFAYADLPIGKEFEIIYSCSEPSKYTETSVRLTAVTQQLAFESDGIPHGWKTICIFEFLSGVPEIISGLPIVQGWYVSDTKEHVCICNKESFDAIKISRPV